ncbi:MAG: helix-turn-helix transcriptional regulator [Bacteroidetes bacterium]|nr:helix-turn-helix transcriptional regulator [Bacteroidota bacterium]
MQRFVPLENNMANNHAGNIVDHSVVRQFEKNIPIRNFSIKYVHTGHESYRINGKPLNVKEGHYLLANHHSSAHLYVDCKQDVHGICIDVDRHLLSQVVSSYAHPDLVQMDSTQLNFFARENYAPSVLSSKQTNVGANLASICNRIIATTQGQFTLPTDFYYQVAKALIDDHIKMHNELQSITVVKQSTRLELHQRLIRGKEFMDDYFLHNLNVKSIAEVCGLSEFHFYRLFRSVFKVTPHKYLTTKKLIHCHTLIQCGHHSITEVASQSGYSDIHSFSKAFKQHFGVSPSKYLQ